MKYRPKTSNGANLSALYDRVDAIRMTTADRTYAKAALAQADAVAASLLALAHFAKRRLGGRSLRGSSAH